jgi:hypothetical protein
MAVKYSFLCCGIVCGIVGIAFIVFPSHAQFSTSSDNCANVCLKFDVGSANSIDSLGFNNSNGSGNNLRWQASIVWRPHAPEVVQAEAERIKQRLEDNKTLITTLAEAIAQNKPELARGIAIILAPRLNYPDPKVLIAELKEGTINLGATPIAIQKTAIKVSSRNVETLTTSAPTTPDVTELQ